MLFSSIIFLFLFLPLTLLGYYLIPEKYKNYWLLFTSLIFFAWGGVSETVILIISIVINYYFGIAIQKYIDTKKSYLFLFWGVTINLLILGVFKYANFFVGNLNQILSVFEMPNLQQTRIALPIGISFYTFHSLSYLVDIYKKKSTAQKNILDLSLYICMFSQLIAGPIIRYSDIWRQLTERVHTLSKFASGTQRFLIGLGKKVLLANTFARIADDLFGGNVDNLNAPTAWLGIICYTLQIYYDFAGYSDMAIGLGRMFGFEFMENFNFPYVAKSVTDFWRRWHISLSSFFRDYVYIPLGGNRISERKTYTNLLIVFFLTGFWHGASWTFILWGLFYGIFMVIERLGFNKILERIWQPIANLYTLLIVMFAWVLFRADTLAYALSYWKALFNFNVSQNETNLFFSFMDRELVLTLIIGILGALGFFNLFKNPIQKLSSSTAFTYSFNTVSVLFYAFILIMSSMYLIAGSYNPFIYYRF
ncbi:MBOAT family O-acyltransferase [uncultured Cytophaga sp.]|uniref:MBOAT family O-acyltransferase n=1 Tax=uncultured Cytophaga sp. TaxID=160238 RepID=UPI00260C2CC9|nr:MBOAT family O-acyltransferase [uncultured Cytophaga sp.]